MRCRASARALTVPSWGYRRVPRSSVLMACTLTPARVESSSWVRPAATRCRRSSAANCDSTPVTPCARHICMGELYGLYLVTRTGPAAELHLLDYWGGEAHVGVPGCPCGSDGGFRAGGRL